MKQRIDVLKKRLRKFLKVRKDEKLEIHLWGDAFPGRIAEISIMSGNGGESWMQSDPPAFALLFACERYLIEPETSELPHQLRLVEFAAKGELT